MNHLNKSDCVCGGTFRPGPMISKPNEIILFHSFPLCHFFLKLDKAEFLKLNEQKAEKN